MGTSVREIFRQAKVERIRAEIAKGEYVSPSKVEATADAVLCRLRSEEERWRTYRVLVRVIPLLPGSTEPDWVKMRSEWRTCGGHSYLDALRRFGTDLTMVIAVKVGETVVIPERGEVVLVDEGGEL